MGTLEAKGVQSGGGGGGEERKRIKTSIFVYLRKSDHWSTVAFVLPGLPHGIFCFKNLLSFLGCGIIQKLTISDYELEISFTCRWLKRMNSN